MKSTLRRAADHAVRAVDPHEAVRKWLAGTPESQQWSDVVIVAVGKAAAAMASGAASRLDSQIARCLVVSDHDAPVPPGCELIVGGHPVPNSASEIAGRRALDVASDAAPDSVVMFLISGGGSALLEVPAPGLTIEHVVAVTELLLRSGAAITEINTVRPHLSAVKGGRLAAATSAQHVTVAVSDVIGSLPHAIASGPTVLPVSTPADALEVLDRLGLVRSVPRAVIDVLGADRPPPTITEGSFHVVADGSVAAHAAAEALQTGGYVATIHSVGLSGEASQAARDVYSQVAPGTVGVFAGETTVTVRGAGLGGRNQEAALSLAPVLAGTEHVALFMGTDGIDGPTDAAGAIVDGDTMRLLDQAGVDVGAVLAANDSYGALDRVGALLRTGPTGTNVGDIWLISRR